MQKEQKTVTISIKPHLKKFLLNRFKQKEGPIDVTMNNFLSELIHDIWRDGRRKVNGNDAYTDCIEIRVTQFFERRSLTPYQLSRLNLKLDKMFRECMYIWIESQRNIGVPAYKASEGFLKYMGIKESEYSKETAYRSWSRYINKEYHRNRAA